MAAAVAALAGFVRLGKGGNRGKRSVSAPAGQQRGAAAHSPARSNRDHRRPRFVFPGSGW